jgi:hypothetical protein
MAKFRPGSAEDIRERGLWNVAADITGLREMPHQFMQGVRSIPGGLASLPEMLVPSSDINRENRQNLPSNRIHDALGYDWRNPTKKPLGQLAATAGGIADIAVPAGTIKLGLNTVRGLRKSVQAPNVPPTDMSRRDFMKKTGLAAGIGTLGVTGTKLASKAADETANLGKLSASQTKLAEDAADTIQRNQLKRFMVEDRIDSVNQTAGKMWGDTYTTAGRIRPAQQQRRIQEADNAIRGAQYQIRKEAPDFKVKGRSPEEMKKLADEYSGLEHQLSKTQEELNKAYEFATDVYGPEKAQKVTRQLEDKVDDLEVKKLEFKVNNLPKSKKATEALKLRKDLREFRKAHFKIREEVKQELLKSKNKSGQCYQRG